MQVLVPLFFFAMILGIVKLSIDYSKWKREHAAGDGSVGTSELKELIREAVEEANAPLYERIEDLERKLKHQREPRFMPLEETASPSERT